MKLFHDILIGSTLSNSTYTQSLTVSATVDDGSVQIEGFYLTRQQLEVIRDKIDSYLDPTADKNKVSASTIVTSKSVTTEYMQTTSDELGAEFLKKMNQEVAQRIKQQQESGMVELLQEDVNQRANEIERQSEARRLFKIDPRLVVATCDDTQQSENYAWKAELELITEMGQIILFAHASSEKKARTKLDRKVENLLAAIACKGSKIETASIRLDLNQVTTEKGSTHYEGSWSEWHAVITLNERELVGSGDTEEEAITDLNIQFQQIVSSLAA